MLVSSKSDDRYLGEINGKAQEKATINEHIGTLGATDTILEIGPGGGAALHEILDAIKRFKPNQRPNIIAIDLAEAPLRIVEELIAATNSEITDGSKINGLAIRANATELPLADNSISAVNLSSIVHEIFSYGGENTGIKKFIAELNRVVKPGGIIAYRDPEGTELFKSAATYLHSKFIRIFAATFFQKYFKSEPANAQGIRSQYYENTKVSIDGVRTSASDIPVEAIVNAENVLLSTYAGLIHELKRHFVVFMTSLFPEIFHDKEVKYDSEIQYEFSRNSGARALKHYCTENGLQFKEGHNERIVTVDKETATRFEHDAQARFEKMHEPSKIKCANPKSCTQISDFLSRNSISYVQEDCTITISFRDLVLSYTQISDFAKEQQIQLTIDKDVNDACQWYEREGSESYFYGDYIDIIATFIEHSLKKDRDNSAIGYTCFVPISLLHSQFISRDHYREYVAQSVKDIAGQYTDGKRSIHFVKKPLEEVFSTLFNLYNHTGDERIRKILHNLLELAKKSLDTDSSAHDKRKAEDDLISKTTENVTVIGLAGGIASGKTSVAAVLADHGFTIFEMSELIRTEIEEAGIVNPKRADYFDIANAKRATNGNGYWAQKTHEAVRTLDGNLVISGIRTPEEIEYFRRAYKNFIAVAVELPEEDRISRVTTRLRIIDPQSTDAIISDMRREMADDKPEGCQLAKALSMCEITITPDGKLEELATKCVKMLSDLSTSQD